MSLKNFVGRETGLLSKQHSIIPDKYLIINNRKLYHLLLPRDVRKNGTFKRIKLITHKIMNTSQLLRRVAALSQVAQ